MDTSAIAYRVADFLKQHPPFHAVDEVDLIALAARGRVRFHEANEFLLWQGEPHKLHVFVIQQGTVSLWDETSGRAELRDVRGPGDLLGVEQFNGARACLYSARSGSDVVVYGFPADDFARLVLKYPYARQFVEALGAVSSDFQATDGRPDPQRMFLNDVAGPLQTVQPEDTIAEAARILSRTGVDAIGVVDTDARPVGLLTSSALLDWVASGAGTPNRPVSDLLANQLVPTVRPDATMTDGVVTMGASETAAIAMTMDGTPKGRLLAVITPRDLTPAFGDQPAEILQDIRAARHLHELKALNQRARACALQHLTSARATEWLARFATLADEAILKRILAITGTADDPVCWCVCGTSGRAESIARRRPHVVMIYDDNPAKAGSSRTDLDGAWDPMDSYVKVEDGLAACGYIGGFETPFDASYYSASATEWRRRYNGWMRNPVMEQMARARPLFDLRPFHGKRALWDEVQASVGESVGRDVVQVLAHDCLASLPPLTFFQNAVVEESGEQSSVFKLEHSALQPLVDVGRVFGMAARRVMGTSTLERFGLARSLVPAREAIFRDAAATFSIVLWQQARIGISQGTTGSELPPALLSRADRHMLKSGFPAIHRLLEFTTDQAWLDAL